MCVMALKSMTQALKAQRILSSAFVEAEIIKLEPHMTKKGCAYGIGFNCINLDIARKILNSKSIKYSEIITM